MANRESAASRNPSPELSVKMTKQIREIFVFLSRPKNESFDGSDSERRINQSGYITVVTREHDNTTKSN